MQTEQLELSLPYEQITSVLGRTALRAKYKISSEEYYKVPFSDLSIREGFNKRIVYDNMEDVVKWVIEKYNIDEEKIWALMVEAAKADSEVQQHE